MSNAQLIGLPIFGGMHITEMLDVGVDMLYTMETVKDDSSTTKYNYLQPALSFGLHGRRFEGSARYQAGTKAKGTVSGSDSTSQSQTSSDMNLPSETGLCGRFLVLQSLFLGGAVKMESEPKASTSTFGGEVGFVTGSMQFVGGFNFSSEVRTSDLSDSKTTQDTSTVSFEGVLLNAEKHPKVAAGVTYAPVTGKTDSGTISGNLITFLGGLFLHF